MATYYIDFEGGNDASAGTSFATRWKTITNGATAARIAPGDEIRIMASPDPTSIGNATWTGTARPNSVGISSSTNATPIVVTTTLDHGLVAGDYVVITSHSSNTNANGTWKVGTVPSSNTFQILQIDGANTSGNGTGSGGSVSKVNNCIVKTASPLVQNIALQGGLGQIPAWTASTNVTATSTTVNFKEGGACAQISVGAAFTTGKAAYYTLPSTLDLSGYQQVSFWVRNTGGTVGASGQTYIALCTDTTGDTVAHQCNVPALGNNSVWLPVTVNLGTNLNSAIRSVAFYVTSDLGAQVFQIDDIIACKAASSADSITLQSLISKSDGTGAANWYAIQSINSDAIMLANSNTNSGSSPNIRGYWGATETVTTYKRETIKTTIAASSTEPVSVLNDNGTDGSPITYSGGWNRTDMSTQTGETWCDGQNGNGYGLYPLSTTGSYTNIERINFCRYNVGFYGATNTLSYVNVSNMAVTASTGWAVQLTGTRSTDVSFNNLYLDNNNSGLQLGGFGHTVDVLYANSCTSSFQANAGTVFTAGTFNTSNVASTVVSTTNTLKSTIGALNIYWCASYPVIVSGGILYINGGILDSTGYGIGLANSPTLYLNNLTINIANEFAFTAASLAFIVYSNRHDNTDGNNWVFQTAGTVNQQTAVVDSPATTAWKLSPTISPANPSVPVELKLGTVVCAAGSLVTVTARMRRSNTGLTMRLACPGGQISGVSSTVYSDMTAAADTWETVTITFTPTKAGAVDIYAYAFGGTTYSGYVCNLTASQA